MVCKLYPPVVSLARNGITLSRGLLEALGAYCYATTWMSVHILEDGMLSGLSTHIPGPYRHSCSDTECSLSSLTYIGRLHD